ncbi:MAG TPA: hypothetical protein VLC98_07590 [Phnomibacter sp.]|nr:hypothetical protein [Phnomibacter sp.]
MRNKNLSGFLIGMFLLVCTQAIAQSQEQCAAAIGNKTREIIGQIKVKSSDNRFIVDDANFTMVNNQATILFKSGKDEFYYNFSPADIVEMKDGKLDATSPVGVIVIKLKDYIGQSVNDYRKGDTKVSYTNYVYLNYLKKDPKNYTQLQKLLWRLKELTEASENENGLKQVIKNYMTYSDFWTSAKNESYTYSLLDAYYSGNSLKYFYKLERVTLSSTKTDKYMVVVPLANVEALVLNKKNARPASYWLESGKNGFEVFVYNSKDESYVSYNSQTKMPAFTEMLSGSGHAEFTRAFEDAARSAGGKLKVRVAD